MIVQCRSHPALGLSLRPLGRALVTHRTWYQVSCGLFGLILAYWLTHGSFKYYVAKRGSNIDTKSSYFEVYNNRPDPPFGRSYSDAHPQIICVSLHALSSVYLTYLWSATPLNFEASILSHSFVLSQGSAHRINAPTPSSFPTLKWPQSRLPSS